jgi:hypothetical protein
MRKLLVTVVALLVLGGVAMAAAAPKASGNSAVVSGMVSSNDGKFFLTDSTGATFEVRAQGLEKHVGRQVSLRGQLTAGSAGSPDVLTVPSANAVAGSTKAAAAGVKAGVSKAVVAGITAGAAAATVGTLYATDVIGGDEEPVSRR